jgi:single-strand DNA-binding protein
MNVCVFSGNLGADAQLRVLPGGESKLSFRVAVNESFRDASGVRKERTDWIWCALFGKRADALAKHLTRGTGVCVSGSMRCDLVGKGNDAKEYWSLRIDKLDFTSSKQSAQRTIDEPSEESSGDGGGSGSTPVKAPPIDDSDIPFLRQDWPGD